MNFIRAIDDAKNSNPGKHRGKWRILANASATMSLDGVIDDFLRHPRDCDFDGGDFLTSRLCPLIINNPRCF
jgi:hypothetical protein